MQKKQLYVDSSAIIIGIGNRASNSAVLLELVSAKQLESFTSEKTLKEVGNYFLTHFTEREARFATRLIQNNFTVILVSDVRKEMSQWRGKIKEKDLEHLATAKALRLPYIVAFDRDFKPFREYRTPKQFLQELGIKPRETEY